MPTTPGRTREPTVVRAQRAVYVAFIGSGFSFASWASRIPQIRDALYQNEAGVGEGLLDSGRIS